MGVQLEVPGSLRRSCESTPSSSSEANRHRMCQQYAGWAHPDVSARVSFLARPSCLLGLPGPFPALRVRTLSGAMRKTPPCTSDTPSWSLPTGNGFVLPQFGSLVIIESLNDCGEPAEVFPTTQRTLRTNISFVYIVGVSLLCAGAMSGWLGLVFPTGRAYCGHLRRLAGDSRELSDENFSVV